MLLMDESDGLKGELFPMRNMLMILRSVIILIRCTCSNNDYDNDNNNYNYNNNNNGKMIVRDMEKIIIILLASDQYHFFK